jgi:hypothetical protein
VSLRRPRACLNKKSPPRNLDGPVLCPRHNPPRSYQIISVTREQRLAIGTPSQTDTLGLSALLAYGNELRLKLIDLTLLFEVEDYDATGSGSAEPVAVRGEHQGMDLIAGVEGVEVFALV